MWTTAQLRAVAERIFKAWDVEVEPAVRPDWPELPQRIQDRWIVVAQSALAAASEIPLPVILHCPECGERHIDEGEFATRPHHTHACQRCGLCWRPAIHPTSGVQFLPGFKNAAKEQR